MINQGEKDLFDFGWSVLLVDGLDFFMCLIVPDYDFDTIKPVVLLINCYRLSETY